MSRYTITTLRADVAKINGWAADDGLSVRLEIGGRYGYQAIDEYPVNADGEREGTCINRNVECGSSRECGFAAYKWYNNWVQLKRATKRLAEQHKRATAHNSK